MSVHTEQDPAVERARKRLEELRGLYIHIAMYVVINVGLVAIDLIGGGGFEWSRWVLIGWGIGLASHLTVYGFEAMTSGNWQAKKLAQYTEQERRRDL